VSEPSGIDVRGLIRGVKELENLGKKMAQIEEERQALIRAANRGIFFARQRRLERLQSLTRQFREKKAKEKLNV
jgi:hypothetical protein